MTTTANIANLRTTFEAEAERQSNGYKTGSFGCIGESERLTAQLRAHNCGGRGGIVLDWYTTRGAERTPVIRVSWLEPSHALRKVIRNGRCIKAKTWEAADRQQLFPFTADGFEAAVKFAETLF